MNKKYFYLIIILLIAVSLAAFGRIAGNDFINFDDPKYITGNDHIKSGINSKSVQWAFTSVVSGNWHPLTMLSHMLDWSLFGANPAGHHMVNLLLHIGAVVFLFLFLNKATNNLWPSAFTAALFALHPLRVESIAWASERKDVLSMFFAMTCLWAYAVYAQKATLSKYFLCLTLFTLGLMSKPMLVTLPFVLMLMDYWPLERWQKTFALAEVPVTSAEEKKTKAKKHKDDSTRAGDISMPLTNGTQSIRFLLLEKAPFIFLTIISSLLTLWAQNKDSLVISLERIPVPARAANAIISYGSYLGKTFWPVDMAIHYPYEKTFPFGQFLISCFILTGITIVVIYTIKKLPFLFVGWFWYLGTLVPVIGLVQVASQAMADRYTYLPSIGIAIMLSFGIPLIFPRKNIQKKVLLPAATAILFVLAFLTWQQCGYWKSSIDLFSHALQATKDNDMAHAGLAVSLFKEGKTMEAIEHYNEAVRIQPIYQFYGKRGIAYNKLGQYQKAIDDYNEAIRLKPDYVDAYYNRGIAHLKQGDKMRGCSDAQKACALGDCNLLQQAKNKTLCP